MTWGTLLIEREYFFFMLQIRYMCRYSLPSTGD